MRRTFCLGLMALLPALSPAYGQDAETTADVRCIVVGMRLSGATDPAQRSAGMMLSLYYIGRLDGRAPSFDLEDAIVQQVSTMKPADYAAEAQRCGGSLQTKGQQITALGEHLIERGRQMQEKSATPSP